MKMRRSSIFEEYARIAKQNGLVLEDDLVKSAQANPVRYDSNTFSDIEALYGIKPNGKEDETHIMEKAHPETMVVGPAYDAFNAIVENNLQRQDMMAYIALKTPTGILNGRRYVKARQELLKSLISTGFQMDSDDQAALMSLADSCADRLQKLALAPLAAVGVAAAVAALGGLAYLAYGSTSVQNVGANSELVINRLHELSAKPYASAILPHVEELKNLAKEFESKRGGIVAESISDVVNVANDGKVKDLIDVIKRYTAKEDEVAAKIPEWKAAINLGLNSESTSADSDWLAKLEDFGETVAPNSWMAYFQDGGQADERELIKELDALNGAIVQSRKTLANVESAVAKYQVRISEEVAKRSAPEAAAQAVPGAAPAADPFQLE